MHYTELMHQSRLENLHAQKMLGGRCTPRRVSHTMITIIHIVDILYTSCLGTLAPGAIVVRGFVTSRIRSQHQNWVYCIRSRKLARNLTWKPSKRAIVYEGPPAASMLYYTLYTIVYIDIHPVIHIYMCVYIYIMIITYHMYHILKVVFYCLAVYRSSLMTALLNSFRRWVQGIYGVRATALMPNPESLTHMLNHGSCCPEAAQIAAKEAADARWHHPLRARLGQRAGRVQAWAEVFSNITVISLIRNSLFWSL